VHANDGTARGLNIKPSQYSQRSFTQRHLASNDTEFLFDEFIGMIEKTETRI
jgi:carbamoylphosphate synthase small subunit